jgi:biopolymer transport protein ExbD
MADIQVEDKSRGGKKKPKKGDARVDMTPMVDLMSLLITFFMLTAAFSKPKVMDIVLPEKLKKDEIVETPKIAESRTLNIILGPNDVVYWYPGKADPDVTILQETDFSATGIRQVLLERNRALFRKIDQFEKDVISGKINIRQDSLRSAISQLKKDDDTGPIVLIKAYKTSKYKNFVDIIDEMSIVGIARYTFTDIDWIEEKLVVDAVNRATPTASVPVQ